MGTNTLILPRASRRFNGSHALLAFGLLVMLASLMFRPVGATAKLPTEVLVYDTPDADKSPVLLKVHDPQSYEFAVAPKGTNKGEIVTFRGVSLLDMFKEAFPDLDLATVPYVKIRRNFDDNENDDRSIALLPFVGLEDGRPPLLLDHAEKPGGGIFTTPAITPGVSLIPGFVRENQIFDFNGRRETIRILPGKGRILNVQVGKKREKSDGELVLRATITGGVPKNGKATYTWYSQDANGRLQITNTNKSYFTSTGTADTTRSNLVNVVVNWVGGDEAGSTGAASYGWVTKKKSDGATTDPGGTGPTGASNGTGGTGTNGTGTNGGGTGNTLPPSTSVPTPAPVTPTPQPAPTPAPTEPTPQPTPETGTSSPDNSGVLELAKAANAGGPLQTVSGVLLMEPVDDPASPGGSNGLTGDPLLNLQKSVQSLASSIFQPVANPRDLWPYLIALLFALGFSGAVREWIKP